MILISNAIQTDLPIGLSGQHPMANDPTHGPNPLVNGYAAGGQTHVLRIMKDIREFYAEDPKTMHIIADENDVTTVHALIRGPERTPYHNGFLYFVFRSVPTHTKPSLNHFFLRFPSDYPLRPPAVKLITTNGRTVRFNPNLYADGKVCLSILGTWQGGSSARQRFLVSYRLFSFTDLKIEV